MGTRPLLYVCPENAAMPLSLDGLEWDWDIHVVSTVRHARELGEAGRFKVGLATLEGWTGPPATFEEMLLLTPAMKWVALTGPATLDSREFRDLIHHGFYDFHTLPPDLGRLSLTLGHAYGMAALNGHDHGDDSAGEYTMIGTSAAMRQLFGTLHKLAAVGVPILIQGESGTGKELAALAIHGQSARAGAPFVAVNCAALPGNLIQSELFGHERGSFTGAHQRKIGKIESAAGGTVFLDEIGDLSLDLQVNLLRFLQSHTIERVGGTDPISVDVRVIAATHVDLERAVAAGRFREDLFYRLNVLHLTMPPLRERGGDVETLAHYFFDEFRCERHPRLKGFSHQAVVAMSAYNWPGNVRELINRVRRAMVMCEQFLITPADLGLIGAVQNNAGLTLDRARDVAERSVIETTLQRVDNNVSEAARQLGISRVTLYRLMQKYNLRLHSMPAHQRKSSLGQERLSEGR